MPLYDFFEKKDPRKLKRKDLPENTDYQYIITKLLLYSELYGKVTEQLKTDGKITNEVINAKKPKIEYDFLMPYDEAAEYFENLGVISAADFYDDLTTNAGQAFTISHINNIETLEYVQFSITSQLEKGVVDPTKLKEIIQQAAVSRGDDPLSLHHLDTVVRTNLQTAFSKGRYEEQKTGPNEFWEYVATIDGRETEICNALDGKIFKRSDPFWSNNYPPNHFNCRSTVVTLDAETLKEEGLSVERSGRDYLKKQGNLKPGKGFSNNPSKGLDKWLDKKAKEHKIAKPKDQKPVTTTKGEKEWLKKQG